MTDPYPWIPSGKSSRNPRLDQYPKHIDLKQVKLFGHIQRLNNEFYFDINPIVHGILPVICAAVGALSFMLWREGEVSGVFPILSAGLFLLTLVSGALHLDSFKPESVKEAISLGLIPTGTNKNIHDTFQRINQIPGWDVVAAQDWAEMCDLADEAAAARSNDLTGPRELQAYNDAIRDYAAHIEHKVARARQIEKGAYTQELDQHRADVIRSRAPEVEQDND